MCKLSIATKVYTDQKILQTPVSTYLLLETSWLSIIMEDFVFCGVGAMLFIGHCLVKELPHNKFSNCLPGRIN